MKKINYIIPCILGMAMLASCEDEPKVTINPAAEDGTLTFVLNEPAYKDYTYVLRAADADETMETLTVRMQPDFGFTAATTYYAQVCFDNKFEDNTYEELGTTGSAQKIAINTKEMNKAITLLQGDNVNENPGVMEVYVRLRAYLTDATTTANGSETIVKPCYSNAIQLHIQPYYMLLQDALPAPYFLVGDFQSWDNSAAAVGTSLVPMSLVENYTYDPVTGAGEFTFTGYFEAGLGYKLVDVPGGWDSQVGMTDGALVFNDGGSGNITVETSGYYTLKANSATLTGSFEAATVTPATYPSMEFVGSFDNWGEAPIVMTQMGMPHLWTAEATFDSDCEGKFRNDSSWSANWGGDSFPYSTIKSGNNIPVQAGTYTIVLNDLDGNYYFFAK